MGPKSCFNSTILFSPSPLSPKVPFASFPVSSCRRIVSSSRHLRFIPSSTSNFPSESGSSDFDVIETIERADGSVVFRFGNVSEIVEKVQVQESKLDLGTNKVDDTGSLNEEGDEHKQEEGNQETRIVKKKSDGVKKDSKSRSKRKKRVTQLAEVHLGEGSNPVVEGPAIDKETVAEVNMSSSGTSVLVSDNIVDGGDGSSMAKGIELPRSSVSTLEQVAEAEDVTPKETSEEKTESEEIAVNLPSSAMKSEVEVPSSHTTIEGSEERIKTDAVHVEAIESGKVDSGKEENGNVGSTSEVNGSLNSEIEDENVDSTSEKMANVDSTKEESEKMDSTSDKILDNHEINERSKPQTDSKVVQVSRTGEDEDVSAVASDIADEDVGAVALDIADEDVGKGDTVVLMPIPLPTESEPRLDEETTHVALSEENMNAASTSDGIIDNLEGQDISQPQTNLEGTQVSETVENGDVNSVMPNVADEDISQSETNLEGRQVSKTVENGDVNSVMPNVADEDIGKVDTLELMSIPIPIEAEPTLEETTNVALSESSLANSSGELKLIDVDVLQLKSDSEIVDSDEQSSKISEVSAVQGIEEQLNNDLSDSKQDLTTEFALSSGAASLRHPSKESAGKEDTDSQALLSGREDAYFVTQNWLGIADVVGQWSLEEPRAGNYAEEFMENCRKIVSNSKEFTIVKPEEVLTKAASESVSFASATVLVAHFDGLVLHVAQIGDSGFILIRKGAVYAKSSHLVHEFNFPTHFGKGDDPTELMERHKIELEEGDIVVTATDGLFDNLYEQEIALAVTKSLESNLKAQEVAELLATSARELGQSRTVRSPYADAAQAAGHVGYTGGKLDDVTVIVSIVEKASST